jgi:prevent-host-death family protein
MRPCNPAYGINANAEFEKQLLIHPPLGTLSAASMRTVEVAVNRYQKKHDQHGQIRYNVPMRTVNISDLKAQLSAHIQFVKDGEEVLICDRNKPVARIVPCRTNDRSKQEQRLIARGVLTPPLKRRLPTVSLPEPPGSISDDVMEQVWREERQGR